MTLRTVRRIVKPIPVVGAFVVLTTAVSVVRRKGLALGCLDVTLDVLPVIGIAKGAVEWFTGELIPDLNPPATDLQPSVIEAA